MEFMPAFRVCASGLAAQRAKMDVMKKNHCFFLRAAKGEF